MHDYLHPNQLGVTKVMAMHMVFIEDSVLDMQLREDPISSKSAKIDPLDEMQTNDVPMQDLLDILPPKDRLGERL